MINIFRYFSLAMLITTIFLLCSCSNVSSFTETETSYIQSQSVTNELTTHVEFSDEEVMKDVLSDSCSENILFWDYDDYDCNGEKEAFAFVGDKNFECMYGTLWFVNSNGAFAVKEDIGSEDIFKFAVNDNTKYVCLSYHTIQGNSLIFGVNNGGVDELPISNIGQRFTILDNNNFTLIQSAFDSSTFASHTWKPYYFYYDNGFHEYGGTEIQVEELLKYNNSDKVIEIVKNDCGKITSILKRNNGIININFTVLETETLQEFEKYYNITLSLQGTSLQYIDKNEGVYLAALVPEIAVY